MKYSPVDSEKALAVMLFLAIELPEDRNCYKVLKAIYRANKCHLERYGREIFRERYQALEFGTVPALAYDIVTHVRDKKSQFFMPRDVREKLHIRGKDTIVALIQPNLDLLSESDLECLREAIEFYRPLTFEQVKNNAHEDAAYNATERDEYIPLERIIRTLPDGELLLKQMTTAS